MYKVSETFYSIQGEGGHAGLPAFFLRLAGCNMWASPSNKSMACPFCDTPQLHEGKDMSLDNILEEFRKFRKKSLIGKPGLVITGGEPLMQLDQEMLDVMSGLFPWVDVETNGSLPLKAHYDPRRVFISCSPKTSISAVKVNPSWWKILIPDKEQLLEGAVAYSPQVPVYLQPTMPPSTEEFEGIDTQEYDANLTRCASLATKYGFGLSIQLHKYLGLQ